MGFIVDAIGSIAGHQHSNNDLNNGLLAYQGLPDAVSKSFAPAIATTQAQYSPFAGVGANGVAGLNGFAPGGNLQGVLNSDPVYNAMLSAGTDAIGRTNASHLLDNSGGTLKALTRFGEQTGSSELNNIFARDNTMANYGLDAASANSSAAAMAAQALAQAHAIAANGVASGYTQKAGNDNSFAGGLTQTLSNGLFGSGGLSSLFPSGMTGSPALNGSVVSSGFPSATAINPSSIGQLASGFSFFG